MELVAFLMARIAEDEAVAEAGRELAPAPWRWGYGGPQGKFGLLTGRLPSWKTDGALIYGDMDQEPAEHIARWDPARVLAECAAKRRIVELHRSAGSYLLGDEGGPREHYCETCGSGEPYEYPTPWPCETLRLLAAPYASHPDYPEATQ